MKKLAHNIVPLMGLILFLIALGILHHALREYHYPDVLRSLNEIPGNRVLTALFLTVINYLALTGYDTLAFRYIRHPLHYGKIAFTSFIGYAFSNNIGLSVLGAGAAGALRYRLYSAWGLSAIEVAKVVAFCTFSFWLGLFALGGLIFIGEPLKIPELLHLPFASVRPLGIVLIGMVGGYLLWSTVRTAPFKFRGWELALPPLRISLPQAAIAAVDWAIAGSVFYVLLPPSAEISFSTALAVFLLAQLAGLISHVPGGLGVFEAVVLHLLSPAVPASSVLGTLLAYRVLYYLLPLVIGATLLGTHEMTRQRERAAWIARLFGRQVPELIPQVLALTTFMGGAILLFSGSTPGLATRLGRLEELIPLPVMEISHFLGSLAGLGLLLLARGLQQRLDAAYFLTTLLLGGGIVFSLLKGLDYEEAVALSLMLFALLPCRRYFYRKASLFGERFTPGWITAIALVLLGSTWIGHFSYKHLEYSHELWWRFSLSGDAPRFLRATVGVIGVALFFAVARLLRPAPPGARTAGEDGTGKGPGDRSGVPKNLCPPGSAGRQIAPVQ